MRAAQNLSEQILTVVTSLMSTLPPWAAGVAVVILLSSWSALRLLRAIDEHRLTKKVCDKIYTERGALEALRIVRSPRDAPTRPWRGRPRTPTLVRS
jgi:hypothetical protein